MSLYSLGHLATTGFGPSPTESWRFPLQIRANFMASFPSCHVATPVAWISQPSTVCSPHVLSGFASTPFGKAARLLMFQTIEMQGAVGQLESSLLMFSFLAIWERVFGLSLSQESWTVHCTRQTCSHFCRGGVTAFALFFRFGTPGFGWRWPLSGRRVRSHCFQETSRKDARPGEQSWVQLVGFHPLCLAQSSEGNKKKSVNSVQVCCFCKWAERLEAGTDTQQRTGFHTFGTRFWSHHLDSSMGSFCCGLPTQRPPPTVCSFFPRCHLGRCHPLANLAEPS